MVRKWKNNFPSKSEKKGEVLKRNVRPLVLQLLKIPEVMGSPREVRAVDHLGEVAGRNTSLRKERQQDKKKGNQISGKSSTSASPPCSRTCGGDVERARRGENRSSNNQLMVKKKTPRGERSQG